MKKNKEKSLNSFFNSLAEPFNCVRLARQKLISRFLSPHIKWQNVLSIGLFFTVCCSCVSVNLGPKGPDKSKNVDFKPPHSPYETLKEAPADGAWINKKNGNSISYLSTCNDPADPPLESVSRELMAELRDNKQIRLESLTFNGREALDQENEGKVDGILTRVRSLIFKKNGCLYTLNYIGRSKTFETDRRVFEDFLKGFQAP